MSTITLNEVERLADRLTPLDQVRLIEYLSRQLAPALAARPAPPAHDAWARLEELRDELAQLPAERLASEQLDAEDSPASAVVTVQTPAAALAALPEP